MGFSVWPEIVMAPAHFKTPLNRVQLTSFLLPFKSKVLTIVFYHCVTQQNSNVVMVGELPSSMDRDNVHHPAGLMANELFVGNDGDYNHAQPFPPTSVRVVRPDSEDSAME
jgi:hypothetical protein